jgi:hypothetical protein
MKTIGYARVSTNEQGTNGVSLEAQAVKIRQQAGLIQAVTRPGKWHFIRDIVRTEGCIEWPFTRVPGPRPYGQVQYQQRLWLTHRLSFTLHSGPIPEGMQVCHRCDNPPCVNPNHLFLGTRRDNMQDSVSKGRNFVPRGNSNKKSKLTEDDIRYIRENHVPMTRNKGPKPLAMKFGVSVGTIVCIVRRQAWKHIL